MATIDKLIKNTRALDMREVVETSMEATKGDMLRRQKGQLLRGERADGKKIGQYKSDKYAEYKHRLNPLAGEGNMDWALTGQLYDEIFADVRDGSVVLDTADPKAEKLIEDHGDPFGLNRDNRGSYAKEELQPEAVMQIRKQILKG
jgi:hypothetical protein